MSSDQDSHLFSGSKFKDFTLNFPNGTVLNGISCLPTRTEATPSSLPLMIGIHGGTCTAHNYDIDAKHTASLASNALGIPFIALNRPNYGRTTSVTGGKNYHLQCAAWLHEQALPALWKEFGQTNGCSAMVVTAHSMAVPVAIIASGLYAAQEEKPYPLAGVILSGYGCRSHPDRGDYLKLGPREAYPEVLHHTPDIRIELMLSNPSLRLCDEEMYKLVLDQAVGMPTEELFSGGGWFREPGRAEEYCGKITVPVLYAIGEHDWLLEATKEHIKEIERMYTQCPRFEGSVVGAAPHAIEWCKAGQGWYVKCFGWASEVLADFDYHERQKKSQLGTS